MTDSSDSTLLDNLLTAHMAGLRAQAAGDVALRVLDEGEELLAEIDARFDEEVVRVQAALAEQPPPGAGTSTRDRDRLAQGRAAMFSLRRAAELLPLDDEEAAAWLRRKGLVQTLGRTKGGRQRQVVVWGDVLDARAAEAEEKEKGKKDKVHRLPTPGKLRRSGLFD